MSDTKFSPGPWKWIEHYSHCGFAHDDEDLPGLVASDGSAVCSFGNETTYYPSEGTPPNEANAHLIAASPDLYAALENILKYSNPSPGQEELYQDGWAVLAKARGEADQ